jgi:hypothetical protein
MNLNFYLNLNHPDNNDVHGTGAAKVYLGRCIVNWGSETSRLKRNFFLTSGWNSYFSLLQVVQVGNCGQLVDTLTSVSVMIIQRRCQQNFSLHSWSLVVDRLWRASNLDCRREDLQVMQVRRLCTAAARWRHLHVRLWRSHLLLVACRIAIGVDFNEKVQGFCYTITALAQLRLDCF